MEQSKCIEVLGLEPEYNQADLIKAYYDMSNTLMSKLEDSDVSQLGEFAESLFDISTAYRQLREEDLITRPKCQLPLIVFTDGSATPDKDIASFAIVIQNIPREFDIDLKLVNKYNLQADPQSTGNIVIISGIVRNINIDLTEMAGIIAALELLKFLAAVTTQKIIIYTDSLTAIKTLDLGKEFNPALSGYSRMRSYCYNLISVNNLDVSLKKVPAHKGYRYNELADLSAKRRLRTI